MRAKLAAFLFCLLISRTVWACQAMNKVWYPKGVVRWSPTQMSGAILAGVQDAINYYATRTPVHFERTEVNRRGLSAEEELGVLEIRYTHAVFNGGYGGQTEGYRNPNEPDKRLRISSKNVTTRAHATGVVGHEMGHVLGFTHEFQRWDAETHGVNVSGLRSLDPFNAGHPDKKDVRVLSPYDLDSAWSAGYHAVSPNHDGPDDGSLLSKHDINCVYRVFARPLGNMDSGILFGEAAASGDFDGDNIGDLAIAAQYLEPGSDYGAIYFYKGVAQDSSEPGAGVTYVPWFRETIRFERGQRHQIVLATGDTHRIKDEVETYPDFIQELIIGLPGAARVEIWVVNSEGRFADKLGTYGGRGIGQKIVITAADVGIQKLAASSEFGASLAAGQLFNASFGDDLAIGAPGATEAVYLLPDNDPAKAIKISNTSNYPAGHFGAALAVMTRFGLYYDTLVVGAPGSDTTPGRVFVYAHASYGVSHSKVIAPEILDSFAGPAGGGFGESLLTFTTREGKDEDPIHWIAVGAPTADAGGIRSGLVDLYTFAFSKERHLTHQFSPATRQEGMHFGRSLAVHQGPCTPDVCPQQQLRIAVGSPEATADGKKTGQVYLWKVWNNGKVAPILESFWNGANAGAQYGEDVISLRRNSDRGGFLVLGKNTTVATMVMKKDPAMPTGEIPVPVVAQTGIGQVRLNMSDASSTWMGWMKVLTPATPADSPPPER